MNAEINDMVKLIDTHGELLIQPFNGGIKLIKPTKKSINHFLNVDKFLKLPLNIYFLDNNVTIQNINEGTLAACHFPSKKRP
jgi:hypothetical protein